VNRKTRARGVHRRLERDDGTSLSYRVVGSGPPVLFVHGIGLDAACWEPQEAGLADEVRLICLDLRGHGKSTTDPATIRIDTFVGDLQAVLRHELDGRGAHVCGNSLGAVLAVHLAVAAPELVTSVLLSDGWTFNEAAASGVEMLAEQARNASMPDIARARVPLAFGPATPSAMIDNAVAVLAAKDHDAYVATARAMWLSDTRDLCELVSQPALVVVGELDAIAPPGRSFELAAALHRAPVEIIAGAGHVPNLEKPYEFNRILMDWVTTVEVGLKSVSTTGAVGRENNPA